MTRITEKIGKVYSDQSNAVHAIRARENFCTRLVTMMDGTRGRRICGMWLQGYSPNDPRPRKTYVVYFFGTHYPAFVWDEDAQCWYGNKTKWSRTTSKYTTQYAPRNVVHWFECEDMLVIAKDGIAKFIEQKVAG